MGEIAGSDRLAAYVDGALEPEEAAGVVIQLADNDQDRRRVDRAHGTEPSAGRRLCRPTWRTGSRADPPQTDDRIARVATAAASHGGRWIAPVGLVAAAAGLALAIGVSIGTRATGPGQPDVGPVAGDLQAVLEDASSGQTVPMDDGREITLIATFRDGCGRFCREFEAKDIGSAQFSRGIACREGLAAWTVAVMVSEPLADPADTSAGYQPAAGATDAALTGALDALDAGPSLGIPVERALIEQGWAD